MPLTEQPRQTDVNRLLAALPHKEYQGLRPYLQEFPLSLGEILYEPGEVMRHVYFVKTGIVSLLSMVEQRSSLEVGIVGNEGMVGISIFLGVPESLNRALVQGAGTAVRMTARAFRKHVGDSGPLAEGLRRYTYSLFKQISQTAACNRFHHVDARLARWLLMTQDRLGSDEFQMTQKFLSDMLGVRREGVTTAARALQKAKLIRYVRGLIKVLNRPGLEAQSCKCYEIVRSDVFPAKTWKD